MFSFLSQLGVLRSTSVSNQIPNRDNFGEGLIMRSPTLEGYEAEYFNITDYNFSYGLTNDFLSFQSTSLKTVIGFYGYGVGYYFSVTTTKKPNSYYSSQTTRTNVLVYGPSHGYWLLITETYRAIPSTVKGTVYLFFGGVTVLSIIIMILGCYIECDGSIFHTSNTNTYPEAPVTNNGSSEIQRRPSFTETPSTNEAGPDKEEPKKVEPVVNPNVPVVVDNPYEQAGLANPYQDNENPAEDWD